MVKKEYCIKTMHNEGMNCFVIYDKDMNMVSRQNQNKSVADAEAALNDFFEAADSGIYTVKVYAFKDQGKTGMPVMGKYLHFDIHHIPSVREKDPLPPVPGYSGAGGMGSMHHETNAWIDKFLGGKDEITGLRLELEKDRIRREYEERIREMQEQHKKELADRENRWEERIMGITSTIAPDLLKGFMGGGKPINGTETATENTMNQNQTESKQKIINAVNKLMQLDPNLAENLDKLCKLAEKSPAMYQQAVNILKSMS